MRGPFGDARSARSPVESPFRSGVVAAGAALRRVPGADSVGQVHWELHMSKRLYIGNLCSTTTKGALTEAFQKDGRQVASVELVMSREPGHSRGFAFVEMVSDIEGEAARQALDGSVIDGRTLKVEVAAERKSRFGGVSGRRSAGR